MTNHGTESTMAGPRRLVGVRLHARAPVAGAPAAASVAWLMSLQQRETQQQREREALERIATALGKSLADLPKEVAARLDQVAGLAVELGLAVAREVVGDALLRGNYDPSATVARCLRDCVHGSRRDDLVVRLHPDDLEPVKTRLAGMPDLAEEFDKARFVADARVPRGAVRAETESGRLRYDPREALERISEEVRREVTA